MGKPTTRGNPSKSEVYSFIFSSPICNANTKKVVLTMELPLTLWPTWLLQDLLLPLLCSNIHSLSLAQLWSNTIIP